MRLTAVARLVASCDPVESFVRLHAELFDILFAVVIDAAPGSLELLAGLRREGLPVVGFERPADRPTDTTRIDHLLTTVERVFRPDLTMLLDGSERLLVDDRATFEAAVRRCLDRHTRGEMIALLPAESPRGDGDLRRQTSPEVLRGRIHRRYRKGDLAAMADPAEERCGRRVLRGVRVVTGERSEARATLCRRTGVVAGLDGLIDQRTTVPPAARRPPVLEVGRGSRASSAREVDAEVSLPEDPPDPFGAMRRLRPRRSGVLSPEYHRQADYADLPPFRYLCRLLRPRSVLDVGCGSGVYLAEFVRRGACRAIGVEGFERPPEFPPEVAFRRHDLRRALRLGESFDLVVCVEVAEHLRRRFARNLVESLHQHAGRHILFSAARPGQPGVGHVNCRPLDEWIGRFALLGWSPVVFDTLAFRCLATLHWFRRNTVLFSREGDTLTGFTSADLESVEAGLPWTGQPPQQIDYPLEERPP